ncbi:hypothetical protein [Natronospirillum operosum]|uniref:hypothetical protein n=1 Tax=Natronospirillum operosum TaxID=2759953 RepID=UPI001436A07C|nr:hypothetical protein [Natronospirillum operosum]
MKALALALVAVVLTGCGTMPGPEPTPPPPAQPLVFCVVPAGLLVAPEAPDRPQGDYSQRDVARYLSDLHAWGSEGWQRIDAIDEWSEHCVQRSGLRTGTGPAAERD